MERSASRTLLSMNDFIGMSLAYCFSLNRKMSRTEQLLLSLWEFCRLVLDRLKFYRTKTWDIRTKNKYQPIAIY
jgi:hypothetical protein